MSAQALFPEGVNTIGAVSATAFFVCLIVAGILFFPFYKLVRNRDPQDTSNFWKNPVARQAFLRFVAVWCVAIACLAVAFTVGGWPTQ